jgi:translation initiation factor 2A
MPAKATLFDQRVKAIHEFGAHPHNFVSWNPQGRLLALAGFGNLAGKIDVFDRRTLNKLTEIDAPNTSHFEWNHDGTMILTATLSPRLRVDNGIKLWWCSGKLLHVQMTDELYQANFRPIARNSIPAFPTNVPPPPAPSQTAETLPVKPAAARTAGAYRPPGAQGRAAPSIFKREDEGGNGAQTPPRGVPGSIGYFESGLNGQGRGGGANGYGRGRGDSPRGRGQGGRYVPGAPPPGSAPGTPPDGDKSKKKKGKGKREDEAPASGTPSGRQTPIALDGYSTPRGGPGTGNRGNSPHPNANTGADKGKMKIAMPQAVEQALLNVPQDAASELSPGGDGMLDPVQKKIRNLNKKVRSVVFFSFSVCKDDELMVEFSSRRLKNSRRRPSAARSSRRRSIRRSNLKRKSGVSSLRCRLLHEAAPSSRYSEKWCSSGASWI